MRALRAIALAGAVLALSAPAAQAQFVQVVTVTVHPTTGGVYADYLERVNEAAEEIGDPRSVSVFRPVMGGSPFRFLLVTSFDDYAEMDSWMGGPAAILTQAHGEREARNIRNEIRDVIESVSVDVYALQPAFSAGTDRPQEVQRYLRLVTTEVTASGNAAYGDMLRAAAIAGDARGLQVNRWTRAQGRSLTHVASWFGDSYADLGMPGPPALLMESLGEGAAGAVLDKADAAVVSRTFETWAYAPGLSRGGM